MEDNVPHILIIFRTTLHQSHDSHMTVTWQYDPFRFHSLLRPSISVPSSLSDKCTNRMSLSSLKAIMYDELGVSLVSFMSTPKCTKTCLARCKLPPLTGVVKNLW